MTSNRNSKGYEHSQLGGVLAPGPEKSCDRSSGHGWSEQLLWKAAGAGTLSWPGIATAAGSQRRAAHRSPQAQGSVQDTVDGRDTQREAGLGQSRGLLQPRPSPLPVALEAHSLDCRTKWVSFCLIHSL